MPKGSAVKLRAYGLGFWGLGFRGLGFRGFAMEAGVGASSRSDVLSGIFQESPFLIIDGGLRSCDATPRCSQGANPPVNCKPNPTPRNSRKP